MKKQINRETINAMEAGEVNSSPVIPKYEVVNLIANTNFMGLRKGHSFRCILSAEVDSFISLGLIIPTRIEHLELTDGEVEQLQLYNQTYGCKGCGK